jgi:hypothetical protein
MTVSDLARQLRKYQRNVGGEDLGHLADFEIIKGFSACEDCGEQPIDDQATLMMIVRLANSIDQFFTLCATNAKPPEER